MKIINPDIKYLICSFKHTSKKDKYITLWGPDNAGYYLSISKAGVYNGYEEGYHRDAFGDNIPLRIDSIKPDMIVKNDQGNVCIKNTPKIRKFIQDNRQILY